MNTELIEEGIVCPECEVWIADQGAVYRCQACRKEYPVKDGIPCFVQLDPQALPFREEYFEFWFKFEQKHFWHIVRREIIYEFTEPFLKRRFSSLRDIRGIEIGIGNGNVAQEFVNHGIPMEGADLFYSSLLFCRRRMNTPLFQADVLKLPFKDRYDFIGIYDIIEHIEDDRAALRNLYKALRPGGILNVTVPACKALWSKFDEWDHKRRYHHDELVEKLKEAGFRIERISYFMFLLFPLIYLVRKIQRYPKETKLQDIKELKIIPGVNRIFLWIFRFEKYLMKFLNYPIGSSLIVIASKPPA